MSDRAIFFLFVVFMLLFLGFLSLFSITPTYSMDMFSDSYLLVKKQAISAILGMLLMFIAARFEPKFFHRIAPYILVTTLLLTIITIILPSSGPKRWIKFGFFSFQPIELAKVAVVLYLARYWSKEISLSSFSVFLKSFVFPGIFFLLFIKQPDFGGAVHIILISIFLSFVGGAYLRWIILSSLTLSPVFFIIMKMKPYRIKRLLVFTDPWKDRLGAGFQAVQSLLAFGSGGIFGVGLGRGTQKLLFLPSAHNDFILPCIAEETGFLGVILISMLFITFAVIGFGTSRRLDNTFDRNVCAGFTFVIVFQSLLNMFISVSLLPTKGLPLPFISYGGSSLIATLFMSGYILGAIERAKDFQ